MALPDPAGVDPYELINRIRHDLHDANLGPRVGLHVEALKVIELAKIRTALESIARYQLPTIENLPAADDEAPF